MNKIALVQSPDRNMNQLQQNISQALNPILQNPLSYGQLLFGVNLSSGTNIINHGLGRVLQGWGVFGINGIASIYDQQATNQTSELTLILVSNAAVTVTLYVC